MGSCIETTEKWIACAFFLAALFVSSFAHAGWNAQPETIAQHPTWIYTPQSTLAGSEKRGLMVVLHGCAQTHEQIKNGGNLEKAADDFGLVMAVPYVTQQDGYTAYYCWNYDKGIADENGHLAEIIAVTKELRSRGDLNIDPVHVYVVGLSSGGALALKLGCKAPELFAGVGAIAGPSVGSDQKYKATVDEKLIPSTNISNALSTCRSLAGGLGSNFASQIANIAYGDMDRNGPKQIEPLCQQVHPGQNCVASIKWSEDNIAILREIYGIGALGPETSVQSGKGTERSATAEEKAVLSLLVVHDVGHAWPAGSGSNNNDDHGQYIAQQGLNYSRYVAGWLTENNRRRLVCDKPVVSGNSFPLACWAGGPNPISSYRVVVAGPSPQDDTLPGAPKFTKQYDNLADGTYTMTVTATDSQGEDSKIVIGGIKVPAEESECVTAANFSHVAEGRAEACGFIGLWACAKGSGDNLGFQYSFFSSSVKETGPDYWTEVNNCPGD